MRHPAYPDKDIPFDAIQKFTSLGWFRVIDYKPVINEQIVKKTIVKTRGRPRVIK